MFIKLPQTDSDNPVLVNPHHIVAVFQVQPQQCEITLTDGTEIDVPLTFDDLQQRIACAIREPMVVECERELDRNQYRRIREAFADAGVNAVILDPVLRLSGETEEAC